MLNEVEEIISETFGLIPKESTCKKILGEVEGLTGQTREECIILAYDLLFNENICNKCQNRNPTDKELLNDPQFIESYNKHLDEEYGY